MKSRGYKDAKRKSRFQGRQIKVVVTKDAKRKAWLQKGQAKCMVTEAKQRRGYEELSKKRGYTEAKRNVWLYTQRPGESRGYEEAKQKVCLHRGQAKKRCGYILRGQAKGVVTKRPSEMGG